MPESKPKKKRPNDMPNEEDYFAALQAIEKDITTIQHRLLIGHVRSAERTASLQELVEPALCENLAEAEAEYMALGGMLSAQLNFIPEPDKDLPQKLHALLVIAEPASVAGGFIEWVLRPEVAAALDKSRL